MLSGNLSPFKGHEALSDRYSSGTMPGAMEKNS